MLVTFAVVVGLLVAIVVFLPQPIKAMLVACVRLLTLLIQVRLHTFSNGGKDYSFVDEVEKQVDKNPNLVQFVCVEDGREMTLAELDEIANKTSHWGISEGLKLRYSHILMI